MKKIEQNTNNHQLIVDSLLGNFEAVKRLLQTFEFDPIQCNKALETAAQYGHIDIVEYLLTQFNPNEIPCNALCLAAAHGQANIVELLIPILDPQLNESEALLDAAYNEQIDVIKLLIPVSDYKIVLNSMVLDSQSTEILQHCVDEYETVQQHIRLLNVVDCLKHTANSNKRKI